MLKIFGVLTRFFPIWIVIFVGIALTNPEPFKTIPKIIPYLLGSVMLFMGLTMKLDDFKLVFKQPKNVIAGIILRYLIMPFVGFGVAHVLGLPPALAAGLILVGCCPSGTASNVMTFLSRGDTALSVTVSSFNTVLAPIITPAMFLLLAGSLVPVNAGAMLIDIAKMVLLPVGLGIAFNMMLPSLIAKVKPYLPGLSTLALLLIIIGGTAVSASRLATVAGIALLAVALHNGIGLGLGYLGARATGMNLFQAKGITFEIGMENSALAMTLALAYLDPIAALPGAIFSVWHNLTGSALATYWGRKAEREEGSLVKAI